eukprot:6048548-Prymnesium_polylepis.1
MPVLFTFIWAVHPDAGDAFDSFLLVQPNATHPNARDPQPLGFSPLEFTLQANVGTVGAVAGALAYKWTLRGARLRPLFAALI